MEAWRVFIVGILLVVMLPAAGAATIYGRIYDLTLSPLEDVIIDINSTPEQHWVSKDGAYSFLVEPGTYGLVATYIDNNEVSLSAREDVTVYGDGIFVVDLVMAPDLSEDFSMLNESSASLVLPEGGGISSGAWRVLLYTGIGVLVVGAVLLVVYYLAPKKKQAEEPVADPTGAQILEFLKQNDRRATQKEIRSSIPMSEAKISLVISELESQGRVKKIKKGRGNIIVLVR